MIELSEQNAAQILHHRGRIDNPQAVTVSELSGGVSNAVFLIEQPGRRFIVKQARGRLRVQADWQCSIERIWREVDVLSACRELVASDRGEQLTLPQLLWADRELYAYAMTAAPADATTWKAELLSGRVSNAFAAAAADLLATLHGRSWQQPAIAARFDDRTYFAQLRLDPYYLAAAENYPLLASQLRHLVDQTWQQRQALVHGDFSPKNLLVSAGQMMLIDFEVGHFGDPAFDLGFFLTHLTLKAIHLAQHRRAMCDALHVFGAAYWSRLTTQISSAELIALQSRTAQHLAGCLTARVHGKSPVDYLTREDQRAAVRLAEQLFAVGAAATWNDTYSLLTTEITALAK